MFINFSNHSLSGWSDEQKEAAQFLGGKIVDVPFPAVPAGLTKTDIDAMAERYVK